MIRVFLADDHPIVRHGLRRLFEDQPDMTVTGEVGDGWGVLRADPATWDVLVLDLSLPTLGGIEVLRRLREDRPGARIVVLSMYPEEQYAGRLLRLGASAYVHKDLSPEELLSAIRRVAEGATYVSPGRKRPTPEAHQPLVHERLTAREYQIFTLLCQGSTVTEIAAELSVTASTVSTHVAKVKEKLGVHSIAAIVSYAHEVGLLGRR